MLAVLASMFAFSLTARRSESKTMSASTMFDSSITIHTLRHIARSYRRLRVEFAGEQADLFSHDGGIRMVEIFYGDGQVVCVPESMANEVGLFVGEGPEVRAQQSLFD